MQISEQSPLLPQRTNPSITQALASSTPNSTYAYCDPKQFLKIFQFGINNLLSTAQSISINLLLLSLGSKQSGTSPLASALQAFLMGATTGFVSAAGQIIADPEFKTGAARVNMANTTLIITASLGLISAAALIGFNESLRYIVAADTADSTLDYFIGYAANNIPTLLLTVGIAFAKDFPTFNLIWQIVVRLTTISCSYVVAKYTNLGPIGIGLAQAMVGWPNTLLYFSALALLLKRIYPAQESLKNLTSLGLWRKIPADFCAYSYQYIAFGLKTAFQRLTEWANLAGIELLIGNWSNNALAASNPSIQLLSAGNMFAYGFGFGLNLSIKEIKNKLDEKIPGYQRLLQNGEPNAVAKAEIDDLLIKLKNNIKIAIVSGIVISALAAVTISLLREQFAKLFLTSDSSVEVKNLANYLILLNAFSLIPDSLRIMTSQALNVWKEIMQPSFYNLVTMSLIGIPMGGLIGAMHGYDVAPLFILRFITLGIAAAYNAYRLYKNVAELKASIPTPSTNATVFAPASTTQTEIMMLSINSVAAPA